MKFVDDDDDDDDVCRPIHEVKRHLSVSCLDIFSAVLLLKGGSAQCVFFAYNRPIFWL